jgi:hypothetical protein
MGKNPYLQKKAHDEFLVSAFLLLMSYLVLSLSFSPPSATNTSLPLSSPPAARLQSMAPSWMINKPQSCVLIKLDSTCVKRRA